VDTFTKLAFNENTWNYLKQVAKDTVERLLELEKKSKQRLRMIKNNNKTKIEEIMIDDLISKARDSKEAFK